MTGTVKTGQYPQSNPDTPNLGEVFMKSRSSKGWMPQPGGDAVYTGKAARLLKRGRRITVTAEASGGRFVVKAIGHKGGVVTFTVDAANLGKPQPDLFD